MGGIHIGKASDFAEIIKRELKKAGREIYLADGEWCSTPLYAVIEQRWKSNKSNFEYTQTEIGRVSADYFTYIGPYDHNIEALSENACVYCGGRAYAFKKKECVVVGGKACYYWGILRLKPEGGYDSI